MSALSEALEHSQAKALAALFKAYTRRAEEPDDGLFLAMIQGVGLDDDVQARFLVRCWRIMRDNPDALPATSGTAKPDEAPPVVDDRTWTRGAHKGKTLADTPQDYLEWAAEKHNDPIARQAAKGELERRAEGVPF